MSIKYGGGMMVKINKILVICLLVLIASSIFITVPSADIISGEIAEVSTEPYIFVPNGSGSELLIDSEDNFYMIHLVSGDIYFRKYSNHVLEIPDIVLFNNGENSRVDAALDCYGYIHLTWSTDAYGGSSVMYMKIDSDGNVMAEPMKLSATNVYIDKESRIASNSLGQAYVVWCYYQGKSSGWPTAVDVLYAKIDSDGSIIFTQENVAPPEWATGFYPNLLIDHDDNVHIVYQRGDRIPEIGYEKTYLYYKKFASDGLTVLVPDTRFTDTHFYYWVSSIDMTLDSQNKINLVYSQSIRLPWEGGAVDTWYMKIDLNGDVLIGPKLVTIDDGCHSSTSYLATDCYDHNYIFWSEHKDGNRDIYYTVLDVNGEILVDLTRLTYTPEPSSTYYMAAVFDSTDNCYWSYCEGGVGTYVIYPVKEDLEILVSKEFLPQEITVSRESPITVRITVLNVGNVDITSIIIHDEFVEHMEANSLGEVIVTVSSDSNETYLIPQGNFNVTLSDCDITISFDLPIWVMPFVWENGKIQIGGEPYYLESIPQNWRIDVLYLLHPIEGLELGTYSASATVTALSETGSSVTETTTAELKVTESIEVVP